MLTAEVTVVSKAASVAIFSRDRMLMAPLKSIAKPAMSASGKRELAKISAVPARRSCDNRTHTLAKSILAPTVGHNGNGSQLHSARAQVACQIKSIVDPKD